MPAPDPDHDRDRRHLRRAARLAWRGRGGAEPNPLVGCVVVDRAGRIVGEGYHRRVGGPHAEIVALRRAGERARGSTVYVTLEPCNHHGRTPPCTRALIEAGVSRVVFAREDPFTPAAGGSKALRDAGMAVERLDCPEAARVADPFMHRRATGLPWVRAKWAQTVDGRVATRTGESQWISSPASRRLVHRERGRVDAILTGLGTVLHDDPSLTARDVRVRRVARRIVVDPRLELPLDSRLARTAREVPVHVIADQDLIAAGPPSVAALRNAGTHLHGAPRGSDDLLVLAPALRDLSAELDLATVLVEAGPGLLSRLFIEDLVNEAWVFTGPLLLGDEHATPPLHGRRAERLLDGVSLELEHLRRRRDDVVALYRVGPRRRSEDRSR